MTWPFCVPFNLSFLSIACIIFYQKKWWTSFWKQNKCLFSPDSFNMLQLKDKVQAHGKVRTIDLTFFQRIISFSLSKVLEIVLMRQKVCLIFTCPCLLQNTFPTTHSIMIEMKRPQAKKVKGYSGDIVILMLLVNSFDS